MHRPVRRLAVDVHDRLASRRKGLTLAEVLVATVLVALIVVGALNGVGSALKMWNASERQGEAYGLAQQLMTEIMQQRYKEPGSFLLSPDSGESWTNRSMWDDVDDYVAWSSSPKNKDGTAIAGYESWHRAASVVWVQRDNPNSPYFLDTGLKRVIVTVTDPQGTVTTLKAWRSDSGMLETPPPADITVQTWIGNELAVAGSGVLQNGTVLVNKPE